MYTPEDIDFEALSDDTLRALALEIDPFIATSALAELSARGGRAALDVARELLGTTSDPWLRGAAFEIVVEGDPALAMRWAGDHVAALDDEDLGKIAEVLRSAEGWAGHPGAEETSAEIERRLGGHAPS